MLGSVIVVQLPMPDDIIERVHTLARRQKVNPGLVFTYRNGQLEPEEQDDDINSNLDDDSYNPSDDEISASSNDDADSDDDSDYFNGGAAHMGHEDVDYGIEEDNEGIDNNDEVTEIPEAHGDEEVKMAGVNAAEDGRDVEIPGVNVTEDDNNYDEASVLDETVAAEVMDEPGVTDDNEQATLDQEMDESYAYMMFLKRKRCGTAKGRGCADGRKQRRYIAKEDASSPTDATEESVFSTALIDAEEGREVAVVDIPGAFMQADMDEETFVRINGKMAEQLIEIDRMMYQPYVTMEGKKTVIYEELLKAGSLWNVVSGLTILGKTQSSVGGWLGFLH